MHAVLKAVQNLLSDKSVATFGAAYRLLRKDRFDHVVRGCNVADKYFKVFFVDNGGENARLGIIASKRSFPRAIDRNRIKRMIRETFRQHDIKMQNLDLVILAKSALFHDVEAGTDKLKSMFGRIEQRCAKF